MKKIKAFTLLETLIVIMVFCIWILVVVHGLSQTLRNKDYANIQIKSAFFAREWIELVFNLRDANYNKKLPWNCIFIPVEKLEPEYKEDVNPFCNDYLWSSDLQILRISMWTGNEYIHVETKKDADIQDFSWMFDEYQLYVHTWMVINNEPWYYYDYIKDGWEETWFARYLVVKWLVADWWNVSKDKLLKIESHVLYQKWALTWEKVMETFIWNYEFKQ